MENNSIIKQLPYKVFPSEQPTIEVLNEDEYGGAHTYILQHSIGFNNGGAEYVEARTIISFVKKNFDGSIDSGVQSEQLIYALLDRTKKLNDKFPSPQNEKMMAGLQMFLDACEERISDRINRGVMGNLKN